MASHITINGRTYTSIDQMPPDVRRQYELAMHRLSRNTVAHTEATVGDISISTSGIAPTPHTFKTLTKLTTSRFVINGKEYARWEDVPAEDKAALKAAGASPQMPFADGSEPFGNAMPMGNGYRLNYNSSSTVSLSLIALIILVIVVLLLGVGIGFLLH